MTHAGHPVGPCALPFSGGENTIKNLGTTDRSETRTAVRATEPRRMTSTGA